MNDMNEKIDKYLDSLHRNWVSGFYGTERCSSLLDRKRKALGLVVGDYEEAEKQLIQTNKEVVGFLEDLSPTGELSENDLIEFNEFCSDLKIREDRKMLLLYAFQEQKKAASLNTQISNDLQDVTEDYMTEATATSLDVIGGALRPIHTLQELKAVVKGAIQLFYDKMRDKQTICHPTIEALFVPLGLDAIPENQLEQVHFMDFLLFSPDGHHWSADTQDMTDRVLATENFYIADIALHTCLKVEYFMLDDLSRLLYQEIEGIGLLYGFKWKTGELGKLKIFTWDEIFHLNKSSTKELSDSSADMDRDKIVGNIEKKSPEAGGLLREYPLPQTPYVLRISHECAQNLFFSTYLPLALQALKDFRNAWSKIRSLQDITESKLTRLILGCASVPIKAAVERSIAFKNFGIGERDFIHLLQDAIDTASELGKACETGNAEIQIVMAACKYQSNGTQRATSMAMGNLGAMVGLAAISGVGKLAGSVREAIAQKRYKSEIDRQIFEKIRPGFELIEIQLEKGLVAVYDAVVEFTGGMKFIVMIELQRKCETILRNIEKIKEAEPEAYQAELVKVVQSIPWHHEALISLFESLEPASDARLALLDMAIELNPGQINQYNILKANVFQQRGDFEQAVNTLGEDPARSSVHVAIETMAIDNPIWLNVREQLTEKDDAFDLWNIYLRLCSAMQGNDYPRAQEALQSLLPYAITEPSKIYLFLFQAGLHVAQGRPEDCRKTLNLLWIHKWGTGFDAIENQIRALAKTWSTVFNSENRKLILDYISEINKVLCHRDIELIKQECCALENGSEKETVLEMHLRLRKAEEAQRWEEVVSIVKKMESAEETDYSQALKICSLNARIQASGHKLDNETERILRDELWYTRFFRSYKHIKESWPKADFEELYKIVEDQVWRALRDKVTSQVESIFESIQTENYPKEHYAQHHIYERLDGVLATVNKILTKNNITPIAPNSILIFYDAPKSKGVITYEGIYAVADNKLYAAGHGVIAHSKKSGIVNTYLELKTYGKDAATTIEIPISSGTYPPIEVLTKVINLASEKWNTLLLSQGNLRVRLAFAALDNLSHWRQALHGLVTEERPWIEVGVFDEKEKLSLILGTNENSHSPEFLTNHWETRIREFCKKINSLNDSKCFAAPAIPEKKLQNLLDALCKQGLNQVRADLAFLLFDGTIWGKADKGFLLTRTGLATNLSGTGMWIPWTELRNVPSGKAGINFEIALNFEAGVGCSLDISNKNTGLAVLSFLEFIYHFQNHVERCIPAAAGSPLAMKELEEKSFSKESKDYHASVEITSSLTVTAKLLGNIASDLGYAAKNNHVLLGEGITDKKKKNAKAKCEIPEDVEILAMIDTTLFGSAKNCLCFTHEGLFWHNDWAVSKGKGPNYMPYQDFKESSFDVKGSEIITFGFPIYTAGSTMSTKDIALYLCAIRDMDQ